MAESSPIWELTFFHVPPGDETPAGHSWCGISGYSRAAHVRLTEYSSDDACQAAFELGTGALSGESWLIRPFPGQPYRPIPDAPVTELRILEVYNSAQATYASGFEKLLAAEYQSAGAGVSSLFEIVIGPARPTLLVFVGWPDLASQSVGGRAVDASSGHEAKLAADRERHGRMIEERRESLLLVPEGSARP